MTTTVAGTTATFRSGTFTIPAPKAVSDFVQLFDSVYGTESDLIAARKAIGQIEVISADSHAY